MRYSLLLLDVNFEIFSPTMHGLKGLLSVTKMQVLELDLKPKSGPIALYGFVENRQSSPILIIGTNEEVLMSRYTKALELYGKYNKHQNIDEDDIILVDDIIY